MLLIISIILLYLFYKKSRIVKLSAPVVIRYQVEEGLDCLG